jgi:hypothetical protein
MKLKKALTQIYLLILRSIRKRKILKGVLEGVNARSNPLKVWDAIAEAIDASKQEANLSSHLPTYIKILKKINAELIRYKNNLADINETAQNFRENNVFKEIRENVFVASCKTESKPVTTGGTGYTKIANDGSELPDSAVLGTKPTDWACTKDNKTGLIWEVKTNDRGLRDTWKRYFWYNPDGTTNGYATYNKGEDKTCPIYPH